MTDTGIGADRSAAWERTAEQWVPAAMTARPDLKSGDRLYEYMRDAGLYVPRSYVRDAWRAEQAARLVSGPMNRQPESMFVPKDWHKETSFKYQEAFIYNVEIKGILRDTGEESIRYVTIEGPERMTPGEIFDRASGFANSYEFVMENGFPELTIVDALFQPGALWQD